jgi:hypothetical protein
MYNKGNKHTAIGIFCILTIKYANAINELGATG